MILFWPALELHGDVKSFTVATFPYEHPLMPPDPLGQGIVDGRAKLELRTRWVDADLHHETWAISGTASAFTTSTGVARQAPEAVDLSWSAVDVDGFSLQGRVDRAVATVHVPHVDVALGRQPISFGAGLFFTPFDLVNPFVPTTIDQEYKPGVDAARVDAFAGTATRLTVAAAYAGDWDLDGVVLAAHGQTTVGVTDLRVLLAEVQGDEVAGLGLTTSVGLVGLHTDATFTSPPEADPFVRAVVGATWRPTTKLTLAGEGYVQSNGAASPEDALTVALDPHWARGEQWALGRWYAAVSAGYELTPLVSPSLAVITNLTDPSVLLSGSLAWSVGDEATVGIGAVVGLGERPELALASEFGTYPASVFANLKAYF